MNSNYVETLNEIVNLATDALVEDEESAAGVAIAQIRDKIEEKQKQGACSCFSLGNGAFPIRRANTESGTMEHVWIDGRRFTMEVVVAEKVDGITKECEFTICDNGQIKLAARYYGGKSKAAKIAHKALKTYVKQLTGASKFHSRGGFLKQALKRLQAKEQA